jgi:hypothetical protein
LHEFNTKERESFIYFIPYTTDNKNTIDSFAEFISKADYGNLEGGEYLKFEIDTKNLVSKNKADEMEKCKFGMFLKLTGKMENPFNGDSVEDMEGDEIATLLNDKFFSNRIPELFVVEQ